MNFGKIVLAQIMQFVPRREDIVELYRERWNADLFFKWIKQHLHNKSFYGTSENAAYTQIWKAVCAFLLLAIAKKRMHIENHLCI